MKLMPKILLIFTIFLTILGLTTTVNAGIPPFYYYWYYHPELIISWGVDVQIDDDDSCIWGVATATTEDEIESGLFPKAPFKHKLFIDGKKIPLQRFVFTDRDYNGDGYGDVFYLEPDLKWWVYYHIFEADDFDVGLYNIVHEMWVQKPYSGSEIHGWRIFINFNGPDDPLIPGVPPEKLVLTYTLTVV